MNKYSIARVLPALTLALGMACYTPVKAEVGGEDAGQFGSITVTKLARDGLSASQRGDWATALQKYSRATRENVKAPELFYGLYQAASRAKDWNQAYSALETIFADDPAAKSHLQAEYGEALTGVGRYEEAIPILKKALLTVDADSAFLSSKIAMMNAKIEKPGEKPNIDPKDYKFIDKDYVAPVPTRELVHGDDVRQDKSKFALSYENLFNYAEFIGICTYEGYEKDRGGDTTFFHPPIAIFHINTILKGPPLNPHMPVRFEFHDKTDTTIPKDWKFGPDKMPKKGEEFLIFVENAVPMRGAFETYHGSFGRQPATEENKNKIYQIQEAHRGQQ